MIASTAHAERVVEGSRSLREYVRAVWRRKAFVVGLVLLGLGAGWLYGKRMPDVYAVTSHIDIAKQRPLGIAQMSFGEGYMESQLYYPTQYSLLASRTYAERLFRPRATATGKTYPMWDWLTWPAYSYAKRPSRTAPSADPDPDEYELGAPIHGAAEFENLVGIPADEFAHRFSFRDYPTRGRDPSAKYSTPADLEGYLANKVVVKPEKGTTLVEISLEGTEQRVLSPLLNLLIEVFSREQRTATQRRLDKEKALLQAEREDLTHDETAELPVARREVETWVKDNALNASTLEQEKVRLAEALRDDEKTVRDATARLAAARPDIDALVPDRGAREEAARTGAKGKPEVETENAVDEALRGQLEAAAKEASDLLGPDEHGIPRRGAALPDDTRFHRLPFVAQDATVVDLSGKLRAARLADTPVAIEKWVRERNLAVRDAVSAFVRTAGRDLSIRMDARLQQAKDEELRRTRWAQAAELAKRQARLDRVTAQIAHIDESTKDIDNRANVERDLKPLRVIQSADDPEHPVRPDRTLLLLVGAGLGLLLGLSLALFLDWLDDTVSDPRDVERHVGSPVLGAILSVPGTDGGGNGSIDRIAAEHPRSPVTEAFRAVRTALEFAPVNGTRGRVILVSSSAPREGKTTVATNLASVLAQDGKRTLLIDADLRKPRVHKIMKVDSLVGLSTVVAGRATLEEAVVPSGQENLSVLPSGPLPPNPAELLGRPAVATLFDRLRRDYDRIVLDTPPVGVVTDAAVLARRADVVVLVAASGTTKKRAAEHGARVFRSVGAEPVGVVLNQVRRGHATYGGYYDVASASYYGDGARDGSRS